MELFRRAWGVGQPVIAMPPLGLESSAFEGFGQVLASRGFRTIAVDLPGFGKTPAPEGPLTPAVLAAPVIALAPYLPWRRFRVFLDCARFIDSGLARAPLARTDVRDVALSPGRPRRAGGRPARLLSRVPGDARELPLGRTRAGPRSGDRSERPVDPVARAVGPRGLRLGRARSVGGARFLASGGAHGAARPAGSVAVCRALGERTTSPVPGRGGGRDRGRHPRRRPGSDRAASPPWSGLRRPAVRGPRAGGLVAA